jgi:Glycosyl transferase family 2
MTRTGTTVGILITAFRRKEYLARAIGSARFQLDPPDEIIVSSDFEVEDGGCRNVRYIRTRTDSLPGHQLAEAFRTMSTDVVSFLDDDDEFRNDKVHRIRTEFEKDKKLTLLRNGFSPVNAAGLPANDYLRFLPQPRNERYLISVDPKPGDFRWIAKNHAYGNLSTISIRRLALLSRLDELEKVEAATDGSIATLMLDAGGGHRFIPGGFTTRRVGTSLRTRGTGGESDRAVRTFESLLGFVTEPLARRYCRYCLAWAKVDRYLRSPGCRLSLEEWGEYVRPRLRSTSATEWIDGARSLWKMVRT